MGVLMAAEVKPSNAAELTLLPKERPLAAEMKAWLEDNLTRLPPDQRAIVMGVEPQQIGLHPGRIEIEQRRKRLSVPLRGGQNQRIQGRAVRRCAGRKGGVRQVSPLKLFADHSHIRTHDDQATSCLETAVSDRFKQGRGSAPADLPAPNRLN